MLGWAIKRSFQGATGANDASGGGEDTAQFEGPDTPAPVFAARAIKNALFGNRNSSEAAKKMDDRSTSKDATSPTKQSPNKQPTSILLTPGGTGTARRKRVSFNHDVKAGSSTLDSSPLASAQHRKTSNLRRALENSRSTRVKRSARTVEEEPSSKPADNESDDEWEDDVNHHDATVDLNEPHSESGKYWKGEFNKYREEAMANIEQLVKYKAMAKSYAKKKDAEAIELAQKLKEEQLKVAKMDEDMAAMSAQIAKKKHGSSNEHNSLEKDLAKQTHLAQRYRDQVKDLEALLKDHEAESRRTRSERRHIDTSPRTEQTILEVNRELRRARAELRQMDKLREENKKLRSSLSAAEERANKYHDDSAHGGAADVAVAKKLEAQLRIAKETSQQKDEEIQKMKRDYESLKKGAKSRTAEALQVLQEKNEKIAALEKTVRELEAANSSGKATRDLMASIESLGKPSKYDEFKSAGRVKRSVSVEDLSLDLTQKSLLGGKEEPKKNPVSNRVKSESMIPSDWSNGFRDTKSQMNKAKDEQAATNKREKDLIMEDREPRGLRSVTKAEPSLPSFDCGRAMSEAFSSRLNRSPTRNSVAHLTPKELLDQRLTESRASRTEKDVDAPVSPVKATPRSSRLRPRSTRPVSYGNDTPEGPGYDLVQDRFARLGGPEPERSGSANSSRCTLPVDRQAAARARLAQKKLERLKNISGNGRDKENIHP
ncbi:spindle pole body formation-associated protein-domain-containing protein [Hypoxylon trugodes]|uniref:spindle pole body formation-associated protein-domain-containing protein n=1 Tax=Hypoxylon trugodes TaxID=326681 RepID=UPI00219D3564|nr:spindle pole body formation-associated protein-domain-containing protein [Hypoxylon trugodes]KAI1391101.1 spindle pole body formation-associated protein-domain-containing protein [Hypoxylon trugodes]